MGTLLDIILNNIWFPILDTIEANPGIYAWGLRVLIFAVLAWGAYLVFKHFQRRPFFYLYLPAHFALLILGYLFYRTGGLDNYFTLVSFEPEAMTVLAAIIHGLYTGTVQTYYLRRQDGFTDANSKIVKIAG